MKPSRLALLLLALVACGQRRELSASAPHAAPEMPAAMLAPAPTGALPSSRTAGPVPDYAPMMAVVSHERLDELAPALRPSLSQHLGGAHRSRDHVWVDAEREDDDSTVWMRDYQPVYVRQPDGSIIAYRYLAENPNRQGYAPPGQGTHRLPIIHENGNLVVAGRFVFLSEAVVEDNEQPWHSPHLLREGYRPRSREDLRSLLARRFFRRPEEIVFVPPMPFEATGHVDLFLLPLDDKTVVIPQIHEVPAAPYVRSAVARVVQVFLDEQADALAALGLRVLRLPMIAPTVHDYDDFSREPRNLDEPIDLVVYSPANSLLVNQGAKRQIFVPTFAELALPPADAPRAAAYVRAWRTAFQAEGWQPQLVDASELAGHLGLFRCVTASVPKP